MCHTLCRQVLWLVVVWITLSEHRRDSLPPFTWKANLPIAPTLPRRRLYFAVACMAAAAWIPRPSGSYDTQGPVVVISGGPSCGDCRIQRYRLATITDSLYPGGATLSSSALVHVRADRQFFVAAGGLMGPTDLYLADRSGLVQRQIGRRGRGPGEYLSPFPILETRHVFLVLDAGQRRVTRLAKDDLSVLGTDSLPLWPRTQPAVFTDGRYVVSGPMRWQTDARPVHIVGSTGQVLRSFGEPGRSELRTRRGLLERVVAISGDSIVWVAHRGV